MRIELTDEIVKAITNCPIIDTNMNCTGNCVLANACLEYWTGDDSCNKEKTNNEICKK